MIKNNIAKYRELKGLDQEELASHLHVTRTYLSKIENQKYTVSAKLMEFVCDYFGVSLGQLFYIDKEEN